MPLNGDAAVADEQSQVQETNSEELVPVVDFNGMTDEDFLGGNFDNPFADQPDKELADGEISLQDNVPTNEATDVNVNEEENLAPTTENTVDELSTELPEESEDNLDEETVTREEAFRQLFSEPIKAGGSEVTFDSYDEVVAALQKSVDYTRKTAEIKPYRTAIAALKEADLLGNTEELNIMIDAFKGNPESIAFLLQKHNVDLASIDGKYTPEQHVKPQADLDFQDVLGSLQESEHYKTFTKNTEQWDDGSYKALYEDPRYLERLVYDTEIGMFDKVNSALTKERILGTYDDTSSNLDNYMRVAIMLERKQQNNENTQPTTVEATKPKQQQPNKSIRNSVAGTPSGLPSKGEQQQSQQVLDNLAKKMANMSDEEWLKYVK